MDKSHSEPAGLSPALKKLLIRPREREEYMDTRKLLRETLNLTRAAMWNGLIEENLDADEFKLNLIDNAFFRKYGMSDVDTMEELLKALKIDDWEDDDFRDLLTLNHIPDSTRRRGILIIDTPTLVERKYWPSEKVELLIGSSMVDEKQSDDPRVEDLLNIDSSVVAKQLDDYVDNLILDSVNATGVPNTVGAFTPKRKTISPPTQNQVARAIKFQRVDESASPNLRLKTGMDTAPETPPGTGNLASPAFGRVKKQKKRKIKAPKRTYTPDLKQTLITSVFSPRNNIQTHGQDL